MVNEYKKLFINAHTFTMRFQGDRDPLLPRPPRGKKKDSHEYKPPWPGNSWSSLGYLPKTLNIKASATGSLKPAKTTVKSPNHPSKDQSYFCSLEGNRFRFPRTILRVETISMLSSNEISRIRNASRHTALDPQEAHLSCPVLCPCCTLFSTRTQVCQPLPFLCQV